MNTEHFQHPHDTAVSAGLRFLTELIAWVAGPWAVTLVSYWLLLPAFFPEPDEKSMLFNDYFGFW